MKKLFYVFASLIGWQQVSAQCTDLFISEYLEGSSFNKAIEIYNPTGSAVDLSTYELRLYSNGQVTFSSFTLSGTLNPGATFVVAHPSANSTILGLANATSSVINFNGDDVMELINNTVAIDRFGIVGTDPGSSWTISGDPNGSKDHTCVRKSSIQTGSTNWTGSGENEWIVYPVDATWYLGDHIMNTCGSPLTGTGNGTGSCIDEPSSFTANGASGTGPYTYGWDFGDGSTNAVSQTTTHTFTAPGTYNITFVVLDGSNFDVYAEAFTITINPAPTACLSTSAIIGCEPETVTFTDCSSGGTTPFSYAWDFDNSSNDNTATPPAQVYNAGTFHPQLIIVDNNGCNDTVTTTFTINASDDATFSYSQSSYCPTDANPLATINGTPGGTFSSATCTVNPTTGEVDIATTANGTYDITYTTPNTCSATSTVSIDIYSVTPDATITAAGPFCTADAATNLTAASSGGIWSGTGITNATNGTFDPSTGAGTYSITYTISGTCGSSDNISIDVNQTPDATITPVASVCEGTTAFDFTAANTGGTWSGTGITNTTNGTFDPSVAGIGCVTITYDITGTCPASDNVQMCVVANDNVIISTSDTLVCNNKSIFAIHANTGGIWSGANVTDLGNGNADYDPLAVAPGVYYAVYTIASTCGDKDSVSITVAAPPAASFNYTLNGFTFTFNNTTSGSNTYSWMVDENSAISTGSGPSYNYTYNNPSNTLIVTLIATNANGCSDTTYQTITPTGIVDVKENNFRLYPNPVNDGVLTISGLSSESQTIKVVNLLGEAVIHLQSNGNNKMQIDMSTIPSGSYIVMISNNATVYNQKIVKY